MIYLPSLEEYADWIVLCVNMGSISHGTHNPDPESIDDIDIMGVVIPPEDYYIGLKSFGSRGTKEIKAGRYDIVLYEMKKFIGLLSKGNPNVVGALFLRPEYYLRVGDAGRMLLSNRERFLTRNLASCILGYANDQLRRLDNSLKLDPSYKGYMGAKRKELVEKYGYDTKYASHLVRLLRMCLEFLETRQLNVYRENDAQELRDIKGGKYQFRDLEGMVIDLFNECKGKLHLISDLPQFPDQDFLNQLTVNLISTHIFNVLQGKKEIAHG